MTDDARADRPVLTPAGLSGRPLLFASADLAYVAEEVRGVWTTDDSADTGWADTVVAELGPGERALGALSFSPDAPAVLHRVVGSERELRGPGTPVVDREWRIREFPTPAEYADMVRAALEQIRDGSLHKVVLGRCLDVVADPPLDPADLIDRLLLTRPGRYVFSVPLSPDGDAAAPGPLLVGASPELLVRRAGTEIQCTPLAGSVPRSDDPVEDAERGQRLLASAKDLAEHAFVVDAIVLALKDVCVDITAPEAPELVRTDTVWHLASPISARLAEGVDGPSALRLAQLLHPTPAVGGVPTAAAQATIAALEGDLRNYFAGAVGWVDASGDGEFAVTIRAAVLDGAHLRLFAGAGIVAGSDPESEVRETGAKLATMARVTGLP